MDIETELERVKIVNLLPGDRLVLETDEEINGEEHRALKAAATEAFGVDVMVLSKCRLAVLRDSPMAFETHWLCEPPAKGVQFTVLEDEWSEDYTLRTIKQIELASDAA